MKNLDKKQAVLCHRKPLGRQRTRQRYLPQCIIGFLLLLISIAIQAQIPQELIDKARAAGMTEEQIQREIAKHRTEQTGINQIIKPATENTVSDRSHPTQQALLPLTEQRDEHKPKQPLENIVFGREIFSDKNLTFEPDLNMPTPKNYVLSAGDELLINVWGDSELNLKLSISPDGTILIPNVGPVSLSGRRTRDLYTLISRHAFQRPLCSRRSKRYRITEKPKSIPEQQRDRQPRCIRLSAEW